MIRWLRQLNRQRGPLQDRLAGLVSTAVTASIAVTGIAAFLLTDLVVYSQLDDELRQIARTTGNWISGDVEGLGGLNNDALATANATILVIRADSQRFPEQPDTVLQPTAEDLAIARLQTGT
ncbi:MAG: hypothetical protein LBQ92_03155, partial [Propionibacteriaceae bacterium]|nr:hypothetical protein [Propionibacteriaceae bacterium]